MATITGNNDHNFLQGTSAHDWLIGLEGDDVLYGMQGNDTLEGGAGADYLHGGDGFDYADYGNSTAVLVDLTNNSGAGGQAFGDYYVSIEGIRGSQQGDLLSGNAVTNFIYGRGGHDVLQGRGGNDLLYGGSDNDVLDGGDGDDGLEGGLGADQIDGGAGNDTASYLNSSAGVVVNLTTGRGAGGDAEGDTYSSIETVLGSILYADTIIGNDAANYVVGEGPQDSIEGRGGNDTIFGDGFVSGGSGDDRIIAYNSPSTLNGVLGNDFIIGSYQVDRIEGGQGNDTILGSSGGDLLFGNAGADTFRYYAAEQSMTGKGLTDRIADFSKAQADRIDLADIDAVPASEDENSFIFIGSAQFSGVAGQLRIATGATDTFVIGDTNGDRASDLVIALTGVIAFAASDFIL